MALSKHPRPQTGPPPSLPPMFLFAFWADGIRGWDQKSGDSGAQWDGWEGNPVGGGLEFRIFGEVMLWVRADVMQ